MENLKLYVVRNAEGKFFRSKGYGGYGETWVDDVSKAKVYTKIGQARSRVTFFFNNWPEYGVADILELYDFKFNVLNEEDRVNKQKIKKEQRKLQEQKREAKNKLDRAQREFDAAQDKLNKLK